MRCVFLLVILCGLYGIPNASHAQLTTPTHWKWVTDAPVELLTDSPASDSSWFFVSMPPGWHVTTGPGAFLFDPAYRAQGRFAVETKIFLFPNPSQQGYGVFLGDPESEADGGATMAFLIRSDGSAAIVRNVDGTPHFLRAWQRHDAVRLQEGEDTVENILRVSVEPDIVTFEVNDETVASLPREQMLMEPYFGLRIGAELNVHVSYLDLTQRLALPRQSGE